MDQIIQQQKNNLPEELKIYLGQPDLASRIESMLEGQPLQQEQVDAFGVEVMLVLLHLQSLAAFGMNIRHAMQISQSRADELARKTKQEIFAPVQDFLIADETIEDANEASGVSGDIVAPQQQKEQVTPAAPRKNDPYKEQVENVPNALHHEVPTPQQNTSVSQSAPNVEQKIKQDQVDSLDIFKKRLQKPVHTPAQEEQVSGNTSTPGERIANTNPSSKESIEKDPYKETIE